MGVIKDSLYGFVIGDAMGVPVEFMSRSKLKDNPVTSMIGYGSYDIPAGIWSDDSSMTLATIDSIVKNNGKIVYNDIADCFCEWLNHGKYTATGVVFDVGITTKYAMYKYMDEKVDAIECGSNTFNNNGNGSLMRMLPIVWYCYYNNINDDEIINIISNVSSITHAHSISIMGCYIYVKYLLFILSGDDKYEAYNKVKKLNYDYFDYDTKKVYDRLLNNNIYEFDIDDIISSGYVVYTLEAVLWLVINNDNYNATIIKAINMGDDTDTVAAISGSIAGIIYGYNNINEEWVDDLKSKDILDDLINKISNVWEV